MKPSRAYLSNKMTGHVDYNYAWFDRIAALLRKHHWRVVNPAEAFAGATDLPFSTYMRNDVAELLHVDTVIVGPEWRESPGAVLEVSVAVALGLEVLAIAEEAGGFTLKPALPVFERDRERLEHVLTYVMQPEAGDDVVPDEEVLAFEEEPRPFQVGDRVRVRAGQEHSMLSAGEFEVTALEEVAGTVHLGLDGSRSGDWNPRRFELVTPAEKVLEQKVLEAAAFPSRIILPGGGLVGGSPASGEVRTVSATGGEKGVKPARFDLIPPGFLWALAEHFGVGARKYDDNNWQRGYEWSKSYGALQRHLFAWIAGEDIDAETGSNHLIAVAWHACCLHWFSANRPEFDDRPKGAGL
jgi:hypothetical protein